MTHEEEKQLKIEILSRLDDLNPDINIIKDLYLRHQTREMVAGAMRILADHKLTAARLEYDDENQIYLMVQVPDEEGRPVFVTAGDALPDYPDPVREAIETWDGSLGQTAKNVPLEFVRDVVAKDMALVDGEHWLNVAYGEDLIPLARQLAEARRRETKALDPDAPRENNAPRSRHRP